MRRHMPVLARGCDRVSLHLTIIFIMVGCNPFELVPYQLPEAAMLVETHGEDALRRVLHKIQPPMPMPSDFIQAAPPDDEEARGRYEDEMERYIDEFTEWFDNEFDVILTQCVQAASEPPVTIRFV